MNRKVTIELPEPELAWIAISMRKLAAEYRATADFFDERAASDLSANYHDDARALEAAADACALHAPL